MLSRKYNLVNNVTGWAVFVIALVTYWLTLEPTASYWDCGEFIIQADKLEVGHPPGNPIFMLTARFFANFAPNSTYVALMVNAMSGLLSALTILLLFWTITHLTRRLLLHNDDKNEMTLPRLITIMTSGLVGALAYCWSDTFWFSAVEGEVYAFSSFCTALVFWLILKWEDKADNPDSDKYLILIAYVIGVSIAVHLLNLLCIPAIVLVFAYRKWNNMNLTKSIIALLVSFVIIALVLFGLVPGFIHIAQSFELIFVNVLHLSFNSGALAYAIIAAALFIWTIVELRLQRSPKLMKILFIVSVYLSGMLFLGGNDWVGTLLTIALAVVMFTKYGRAISVRVLYCIMWSIAVIFVGYSSYALILIRSSADTPMNQNSPDNVFDLSYYLSREQYGETPLIYGQTLYSGVQRELVDMRVDTLGFDEESGYPYLLNMPQYNQVRLKGAPRYAKGVAGATVSNEGGMMHEGELLMNQKLAERGGDYYVLAGYKEDYKMNPELNMLFPRIYSAQHASAYKTWVQLDTMPGNMTEIYAVDATTGEKVPELDIAAQPYYNQATGSLSFPQRMAYKPTFSQNLAYFFNYQLIHMYMRYFMWNFAGRQNDMLNMQGELDAGNWISGIPFIDNARLGDQSLLPPDLGSENKAHNRYFLLPLLLGLAGLIWQSFAGKRGVEQFWVVFFLFFMTGIAIVLYLNQPPLQPRERDYAYAGSFYAFAIWIGLGVAAMWKGFEHLMGNKRNGSLWAAVAAGVIGLVVPVEMVAQNWDDHDRSGRTAARDYAINYLESLEPNAIVFCNGDNDTFPLWYAQEVEGVRPDVKIINLSYLNSDWYANQMRRESYTAPPVNFTATPQDIAYKKMDVVIPGRESAPADLLTSLKNLYENPEYDPAYNYPVLPSSVFTIPVDKKKVIERGLVAPADTASVVNEIVVDLSNAETVRGRGYVSLGEVLMLDIIATNAANGWERPIYWCSTVGPEYHLSLTDYVRAVGMTHQLVPTMQADMLARTDRVDVVQNYLWGGADSDKAPYFDETARRMLFSTRNSMIAVCQALLAEAKQLKDNGDSAAADKKAKLAVTIADLVQQNLPNRVGPWGIAAGLTLPEVYMNAFDITGNKKYAQQGVEFLEKQMKAMAPYLTYNSKVVSLFGNVSVTSETRMMPYQFYAFIEMYEKYGGKPVIVEEIISNTGYTREQLKKNYEYLYGGGDGEDSMLADMEEIAAAVNLMAGMSADKYNEVSADDRMYDSIFYLLYQRYEQELGDSLLKTLPSVKALDLGRSRRLYEEYARKHPDTADKLQ